MPKCAEAKILAREYLAMVGSGRKSQNPVLLCHDLTFDPSFSWLALPAEYFEESAVRLALGYNVGDFLPEILGYHLASSKEEAVWRALSYRCVAAGLRDDLFKRFFLTRSRIMNESLAAEIFRPFYGSASVLPARVKTGMTLNKSVKLVSRVLDGDLSRRPSHSVQTAHSICEFPNLKSLVEKPPGSVDDDTIWSHQLYDRAAPGCHFTSAGLKAVSILSELAV
ncbi:hypothetical protein RJO15_19685 [Herbaspirillum huttiense F1]|nr:hypothetical protein [Herbaspirillum huttiense F1]